MKSMKSMERREIRGRGGDDDSFLARRIDALAGKEWEVEVVFGGVP
jgi:hypothetical protein